MQRKFNWRFIIADVKQPILGADFIVHYGLIDHTTNINAIGAIAQIDPNLACIKAYNWNNRFRRILAEYKDFTDPNATNGSEKTRVFNHIKTSSYHPQANGLIENWHRTLKAAIMCHQSANWTDKIPIILLGFRSTYKEDIKATPAEMVYGTTLRLPGEFFHESLETKIEPDFVKDFRRAMNGLRPTQTSHHHTPKVFVQKELSECSHVFVRDDTVRPGLKQPYDGPFEVMKRYEKTFKLKIKDKKCHVSIDRLKAAFLPNDALTRFLLCQW